MEPIIANIILSVIIIAIIALIVLYLIKAKRRGDKCIGCPYAKQCGGNCGSQTVENKKKEK